MRTRFATLWVAALVLAAAVPATADVRDYLGKSIASVSLESEGRVLTDRRLTDLVETHIGQPLSIGGVRQSITHLFSLGQFEDVRVHATASGSAVDLKYELVPAHTIGHVSFSGPRTSGIDRGRLQTVVAERFGASPRPTRTPAIVALVSDELRQAGYLRARVTPQPLEVGRDVSSTTLTLAIDPGERTRIGTIRVDGEPGMEPAAFLRELRLVSGAPFERDALNEGIDRYLEGQRQRGYFSARATYSPQLADDDRTANLTMTVTPGPHVNVVFAGDPLPSDRRAELVPIEREGSADEDLLEDSTLRIEEYLRTQGYRDAAAPHARQEAGSELTITFTVTKGPLYRVGRVDFSGNSSIPVGDLQARTRIRPGQPFADAALSADVTIVGDVYRRAGYVTVQVQATIESQPGSGAVDVPVAIRLAITEGPRAIVGSVRVEGGPEPTDVDLRQAVGLQPGQPFSQAQLAVDRDGIQLRLANLGYQSATVVTSPGLSADGTQAEVLFTIRAGPRIFVDHVLIAGNDRTRTATIVRELQFKAGEPLGLENLNESQRRLASLGLFRRVRITELGHGDDTRRDVLVTVEEAPVATVGYGGGLEAGEQLRTDEATGVATARLEFAPRAFFEVGRRNLFGKNRSINLFTRISLRPRDPASVQIAPSTGDGGFGFREYRVLSQYREPGVFGTGADFRVTGTFEQQSRTSFDFARRSASAELAGRLSRTVSLSGGYQIQRSTVLSQRGDPSEQQSIDRILPKVRLSLFSSSLIRDTRDDPVDTGSGQYLSASGQLAARQIGSKVGFVKSFFTAQSFKTVAPQRQIVAALSGRLGMASTFYAPDVAENDLALPASERFFAGGDTTVRGFALDQLGIRGETIDSKNFPSGGSGLVIVNAELRVPLLRGLGVVGFLDSGNVFKYARDIDFGRLRVAGGFGVRYKSPIGPIRVDLGFKLHRQEIVPGQLESLTALHISLGQAF